MKRSKKKDQRIYLVCYENRYEGWDYSVEILGAYFSIEVALHDFIDYLNFEYETDMSYDEESLEEFNEEYSESSNYGNGYGIRWFIKDITVNDKNKINGNAL